MLDWHTAAQKQTMLICGAGNGEKKSFEFENLFANVVK